MGDDLSIPVVTPAVDHAAIIAEHAADIGGLKNEVEHLGESVADHTPRIESLETRADALSDRVAEIPSVSMEYVDALADRVRAIEEKLVEKPIEETVGGDAGDGSDEGDGVEPPEPIVPVNEGKKPSPLDTFARLFG